MGPAQLREGIWSVFCCWERCRTGSLAIAGRPELRVGDKVHAYVLESRKSGVPPHAAA
jgi:hypothetical protein